MSLCFPSTPQKLWMTVAMFLGGSSLFGGGLYLSYVHIAPQQARIQARNDFVRDKLKKKYGLLIINSVMKGFCSSFLAEMHDDMKKALLKPFM
ncbi:hypothetical protein CTI12_AA430270 [Artemisia annua]|uniref:Uncharacterized protein n=1 Tax=Artemisia annua TaxID=35608 RepID=A0A2U1M174_ARTAN|nr:hypothetical protein CTI12_AA430270 [Artemisia annua]